MQKLHCLVALFFLIIKLLGNTRRLLGKSFSQIVGYHKNKIFQSSSAMETSQRDTKPSELLSPKNGLPKKYLDSTLCTQKITKLLVSTSQSVTPLCSVEKYPPKTFFCIFCFDNGYFKNVSLAELLILVFKVKILQQV